MTIQLNHKEKFSDGLKRLILQQCDTALASLNKTDTEKKRHEAVHEARKAFKKVRACLRLVRDKIDFYKEENAFFRDLGRELSDIRDATARIEALDILEKQYGEKLYKSAFDKLRNSLLAYRKNLADNVFRKDNRLEEVRKILSPKILEIKEWKIDVQEIENIRPSLRRVYKRGRHALKKAKASGKMEDYHEWRKRAKYLRYQIDVLNRIWPQVMEVMEDELHDLTDFTGTMHDLHMLDEWLAKHNNAFSSEQERGLMHALLEKHGRLMRIHANLKGAKFYHSTPDQFCDRVEKYWKLHKKELDEDLAIRKDKLVR